MEVTVTPHLPPTRLGAWNHLTRRIYLNNTQTDSEKTLTLAHELIHALAGHQGKQTPETEQWVESQAQKLIKQLNQKPGTPRPAQTRI